MQQNSIKKFKIFIIKLRMIKWTLNIDHCLWLFKRVRIFMLTVKQLITETKVNVHKRQTWLFTIDCYEIHLSHSNGWSTPILFRFSIYHFHDSSYTFNAFTIAFLSVRTHHLSYRYCSSNYKSIHWYNFSLFFISIFCHDNSRAFYHFYHIFVQ